MHLTPSVRLGTTMGTAGRTFSPYVIAGFGIYQTQQEVRVNTGAFIAEADDNETDLGINLGGGLSFRVNELFIVGGDLRYHQIFGGGQDPKLLIPTLRLSWIY